MTPSEHIKEQVLGYENKGVCIGGPDNGTYISKPVDVTKFHVPIWKREPIPELLTSFPNAASVTIEEGEYIYETIYLFGEKVVGFWYFKELGFAEALRQVFVYYGSQAHGARNK